MLFNSLISLFSILASIFPSSIFEEAGIWTLNYSYLISALEEAEIFIWWEILVIQSKIGVFRGYNIWDHQIDLDGHKIFEEYLEV